MHLSRNRDFQEWTWTTPLTASQNVTVPVASESGTMTIGNVISMPFLRFGAYAHRAFDIYFEVSNNWDNWHVPLTVTCVGTTWYDCYALGGTLNLTGYWMVPWALLRIKLDETSGINHDYTRFQAICYTN